jgi:hypothetical protein
MDSVIPAVIAAVLAALLALACGLLAKKYRPLPWLAAATASASLLFAGLGAIAAWFVPDAFAKLLALWLSATAVGLAHLQAAKRSVRGGSARRSHPMSPPTAQPRAPLPASGGRPSTSAPVVF